MLTEFLTVQWSPSISGSICAFQLSAHVVENIAHMNTYSPEARPLLEELARIESEKGKMAIHVLQASNAGAMSSKEAADKMEALERKTNEIERKLVQYRNK